MRGSQSNWDFMLSIIKQMPGPRPQCHLNPSSPDPPLFCK
uniref:Uncharacterized protein n=1 Tax=Anguilla anguilla TaxID=7936 RepID=A0A0E9TJR1_ANGAN